LQENWVPLALPVLSGETDEIHKKRMGRTYSIPDFHATLLAGLGINPSHVFYDGARPVPVTDGGKVIGEMFA